MFWFYILFHTLFFLVLANICISSNEVGGRIFSKKFYKRIKTIESGIACTKTKNISITNKNKQFSIVVKDAEVSPGIKYSTIPVYTCKDVFINDELVCKAHRIDRMFGSSFAIEVSCGRAESEIIELLTLAYKEAKRLDKEHWKETMNKLNPDKSFYTEDDNR